MNRIAKRSVAILILVAVLAGGLGVFVGKYLANGSDWVMHEGSPHIYSGENLGTGLVIDRDGLLLLDLNNNRTYSVSKELRMSTLHWLGDRYGYVNAPALATYAKEMAGYSSLTGLYSYSGAGQAQLTISAHLQMAALEAMGAYKGTLAVYNYKTGEILCAVTTPTYDPDDVPDIQNDTTGAYEGVYMNRFVQSVYIPGSIFKIVTTAAALEELPDIREMTYHCTAIHPYGNDAVTCEYAHGELDFDSALAQSCNCAFAQIVDRLGAEKLKQYVDKYAVTQPVRFDGVTTAAGNFQAAPSKVEAAWSGIGQYVDDFADALASENDSGTKQLHVELWHTDVEDALEDVHHIRCLIPYAHPWLGNHHRPEAALLCVCILEDIDGLRYLLLHGGVGKVERIGPSRHVFKNSHCPFHLFT